MCWFFFLWYFTLQWPGRAASFESQGSCPSPKPPQTPWCSQVEWWHYLWKKPHVCCWEVALPNESFVSMLYEHSFWRISYKFALKQFFFIHVNSSSSSALQSWLCTALTVIQFKSLSFIHLLWNSQNGFICQTFTQTIWMVGLTAKSPQWFSRSCINLIIWATFFRHF